MDQVQCPNCGGYKTTPSGFFGKSVLFDSSIYLYLSFIPILGDLVRKQREEQIHEENARLFEEWQQRFVKGKEKMNCEICGYMFVYSEIPKTPIKPNIPLIEAAKQEEEKRRKMMY